MFSHTIIDTSTGGQGPESETLMLTRERQPYSSAADQEMWSEQESNLPPTTPSFYRLTCFMASSRKSQEALQEWDLQNGLPRSHSATMVHTNRSRRQLELGRVLPKWNGQPLIGTDGAPVVRKKRPTKKKARKSGSSVGEKKTSIKKAKTEAAGRTSSEN